VDEFPVYGRCTCLDGNGPNCTYISVSAIFSEDAYLPKNYVMGPIPYRDFCRPAYIYRDFIFVHIYQRCLCTYDVALCFFLWVVTFFHCHRGFLKLRVFRVILKFGNLNVFLTP